VKVSDWASVPCMAGLHTARCVLRWELTHIMIGRWTHMGGKVAIAKKVQGACTQPGVCQRPPSPMFSLCFNAADSLHRNVTLHTLNQLHPCFPIPFFLIVTVFLSLPPSYRTKQAEVFQKKGRSLRNKMWWNYCKWKLLIIGAIIILAIVIFLIACFSGGRDCTQQGVRDDFEEKSGTNPPR